MLILSISDALSRSAIDIRDPRTLLVLSTTKGNIDLLEKDKARHHGRNGIFLWELADRLSSHFGNPNKPLVICNACISGSLAIITTARLIQAGHYDHAIVAGGDIVTEFVVSGFQSFQALSPGPCKPFDGSRDGLNLGEGSAVMILSADRPGTAGVPVCISGGSTSNDANHISGPSRDGRGLLLAIDRAMQEAGTDAGGLSYISAHGTATLYNDEMEALALSRAGLEKVPVNSFKGFIGHTLGAAGVIESVLSICSLKEGLLLKSAGYSTHGVSRKLNVLKENTRCAGGAILKTASGFGGCNAAIVFSDCDR